jgi:uncharacterized protein YdeI (YjbR/CyaY-like superfamily)
VSEDRVPAGQAFRSPGAFRAWLEKHHGDRTELIVRCYKTRAAGKGLTYPQALDEALCFGWIDGVRRRFDADSFTQRFSPRKAKSIWSAVNIRRASALEAEGRMHAAGLAAFARSGQNSAKGKYSFESKPRSLPAAYVKKFRAVPEAWAYYAARPPGYRRLTAFWVLSAKLEATRERRLGILIDCSRRKTVLPGLERPPR